ncbi:hypothetical protein [Pasteurella multocida]|uniref:hypothetical protein n=1 Tax=Pasteurella multocida TaxID=747 RepID=UPI001E528865|nr:hypothetical protein [Pasteurella multocida]MDC4235845.1 hypothetical protein [Pasteurella multocida]
MMVHILNFIVQFIRKKVFGFLFNSQTKILITLIVLLTIIIGFQYFSIIKLETKTIEQEKTISSQNTTIKTLKQQEEINRQLTLEISRLESESRSKSDEAINSISHDEKSADAYNANAPRSIVEFLRK